jgi:glycosyltransferase involved in cell wall biosynthesis
MSCGIPFISSKSGGPNDIYEEGVGFMVDPGNVTTLRDAMLEFVNLKNSFSKSKIRSIAVKKYSCQAVFEKLIRLYSNVLDTDSKIEV